VTKALIIGGEDLGMMGQFLVLDNGQRPGTPSGHRHHT